MKNRNSNKVKKSKPGLVLAIISALVITSILAFYIYVNNYYKADSYAMSLTEESGEETEYNTNTESISGKLFCGDKLITYENENSDVGFIFYPGGKVQFEAYAPLVEKIGEQGINCFLPKMTFNLAVFDISEADAIIEANPQIKKWYIGGHSLGGVMAAIYASNHTDKIKGLILLAAYSSVDLSDTDLGVLTVYGTEDKVLNTDEYDKSKKNLPDTFTEKIIEGGCHSYFGNYGMQNGDGSPKISREKQQELTAEYISDFVH